MFVLRIQLTLLIGILVTGFGCTRSLVSFDKQPVLRASGIDINPAQIELAEVDDSYINNSAFKTRPRSISDGLPEITRDLSLNEVVAIGLKNPNVLRSLGAQVLVNPELVTTRFDPAIQESNPNFGVEAALSEFDAQFSSSLNYDKNDEVFNNILAGGGANEVRQDLVTGQFSLAKTAATGTLLALRGSTAYDDNNAPQNLFDQSWTSFWEAELRQPLLQGGGIEFNRIVGPNPRSGFRFANGVVISRINHDISISQFEQGVRDFVSEVTDSYWQLDRGYKNYVALKKSRDAALETWQIVKARFEKGIPGGEKDREAQAREQYFQFEQSVVAALNGDRTNQPGLLQNEANLRRLIGIPQNDGQFINPIDQPIKTMVIYDWDDLVFQATTRRVELRQQKWRIKKRELELLASRNFTLPRLDVVGTFRNNGFGHDLVGGGGRFASSLQDLTSGDHNEIAFGVEYNAPIGFRRAHAGVRNAELNLCRERALLEEQERQVLHDLGSTFRLVEAKFTELVFATNRLKAAQETVEARNATYQRDLVSLDVLLESQRRLADAEVTYHQVATEYTLAHIELSREAGTLLSKFGVHLSEEQPCIPCTDDQSRWLASEKSKIIDYRYRYAPPVSGGVYDQEAGSPVPVAETSVVLLQDDVE